MGYHNHSLRLHFDEYNISGFRIHLNSMGCNHLMGNFILLQVLAEQWENIKKELTITHSFLAFFQCMDYIDTVRADTILKVEYFLIQILTASRYFFMDLDI